MQVRSKLSLTGLAQEVGVTGEVLIDSNLVAIIQVWHKATSLALS